MSETTDLLKRLQGLGLSQSEISRRTGIPQPRLSRWGSGSVPDAADDSLKLARLVEELQEAGQPAPDRAAACGDADGDPSDLTVRGNTRVKDREKPCASRKEWS